MKEVAEVMKNSCGCGSEETGSENWSEIITMKLTHERGKSWRVHEEFIQFVEDVEREIRTRGGVACVHD